MDISEHIHVTDYDQKLFDWEEYFIPKKYRKNSLSDKETSDLISMIWDEFGVDDNPPNWELNFDTNEYTFYDYDTHTIYIASSWKKNTYVITHETCHALIPKNGHNKIFLAAICDLYPFVMNIDKNEMTESLLNNGFDIADSWESGKVALPRIVVSFSKNKDILWRKEND